MVSKLSPPLIDVLPCVQFMYTVGDSLLDYVPSVNRSLNFTENANSLYSKANQRLGLLKRTLYFINYTAKRTILF